VTYTTQERIALLMHHWTDENKQGLYRKMQNKGIHGGGILSTIEENTALFEYLRKEVSQ